MIRKPFTILNANSDPAVLQFTSATLKQHGLVALEATTGSECLRLAKEQLPDVILLGLKLPDIDGLEICRRLRAEAGTSHILILLIHAFESAERAQAMTLEAGADGYLSTPFSADELRIHIRSMERIWRNEDDLRSVGEMLEQRVKVRTAALEKTNEELQKEVAEHTRIDAKLRASEVFFREVTENASDMILIIDKKGIISYASPSVERFLGFRPDEMVGKYTFTFIHPEDAPRSKLDFLKALRTEDVTIQNAFRVIHRDGSERIVEGLGKNLLGNKAVEGFIMNVYDVTERRRVEEASRLFLHTLESISEFVTITDLDDRFTFVNQAFLKAYGYKREEVIGQHVRILWSPNNPDGLLKNILDQNRKSNWNGELRNRTKDGREFSISLHTSRIRNEKGEIIGLVGVSEDITERKKAEETLRESESKFRDLVEQINDAIFATDMSGKITYISPIAERLGGYKPDEMIGHSLVEFIDPAFLPAIQERYRKTAPEYLEPIEYRVKTKSGKPLWVRSSSRLVFDGDRPVGMRGVLTNITAQKRAQESVSMLSHTIRSIAECVCITDLKNTILFVNKAFLATYGYTEEEMIGKSIDIVNPAPTTVRKVLDQTIRGSWQGELVNRKKDGTEFPIYLSTSVVHDENGQAIALVGVTTDITERKKIDRELSLQKQHLQESYEQLRELEVARDTLTHMIVHDMRSRLFALMMGLEFLEQHEQRILNEAGRKVLSQALGSTTVLIDMVTSLLDISKMESGEMKLKKSKVDLAELARKVVALHELQRENRHFVINAPPAPVEVTCDADLVSRVILNLFSNALKFTPSDGSITITLLGTEKGATVSIQDSGPGISAHHLPHIFDKFYQAESRGNSTGLGLTFCKLAVELHGGHIGVESEIGRGSTFWFALPSKAE
jgi:PAS domain S-box-containing protein